MPTPVFAAIEAGGTKFVCGVGTGPDDLTTTQILTENPAETIAAAVAWIRSESGAALTGVGVGSFGPVDLNPASPSWGRIGTTPKIVWRGFDLAGEVARGLNLPVAIDTDVNVAALAEARWGAARGLKSFLYLTVGTGIGGGCLVEGKPLHGASHPEMGHIRIPHNWTLDPFAGTCPFHGDCLEGLASGPAIEARWGKAPAELRFHHRAWELEARYLALGLANFACVLSPQLIVIGGGVLGHKELYPRIQQELASVLAGYIAVPPVAAPELGDRAGVLGALALAQAIA